MEVIDPMDFLTEKIFREATFRENVGSFDWSKYNGKPVLIRGCSEVEIPTWAYLIITAQLAAVAKSISFGEVRRPIPIHGKLGQSAPTTAP
jgi:hypothetical protein